MLESTLTSRKRVYNSTYIPMFNAWSFLDSKSIACFQYCGGGGGNCPGMAKPGGGGGGIIPGIPMGGIPIGGGGIMPGMPIGGAIPIGAPIGGGMPIPIGGAIIAC